MRSLYRPRLALAQPEPPAAGGLAVHGRDGLHESGPALVRESCRQGQLPAGFSLRRHLQLGVAAWPAGRHDCAVRNPVGYRRFHASPAGKSGQVHGVARLPHYAHQRPGNLRLAAGQTHVRGIPDQDRRARTGAIHVQPLDGQPPGVLEQQPRLASWLMTDAHVLQTQAIHEPPVQPRRSIRRVLQRDITQGDVPDRRVRQAVYPRRRVHLRDVDTLESEAVDDAPADVHRREVQQPGYPIPPDVVHVHVLDDAARRLART